MGEEVRRDLATRLGRLGRVLQPPRRPRAWVVALLLGLAFYAGVNWLLAAQGSLALVPVSLLLGSFLIPVVVVLWLQESGAACDMPPAAPAMAFLAGSLLGLLGAHVLTPLFFQFPASKVLMIGASEELAKLAAVFSVLLLPMGRACPSGPRAGLVLGAAAGLGFSAMESMGAAFRFLVETGFSQGVMERILFARSLFGPLAHGSWTALLASAAWPLRERRGAGAVALAVAAFAAASGLHALWNMPRLLLSPEVYRNVMAPAIPYLPLPTWHMTFGAFSLVVFYLFVRGRLDWPRRPAKEEVLAELETCLGLAARLDPPVPGADQDPRS